ncbi:MAG TPA: pyridoxal-phosphate dependent enzyme, partial [bacterium]|nr:pyridoxal-phosphate dependent enzyme [bacterium]
IIEDRPETALVVAPIGGGGLAAGLLVALKSAAPRLRLIGVQAAGAPSARLSLRAGRIVCLESIDTYANGIAVKRPGEICFEIISTLIDDIVLVTDEQMRTAQKRLYRSAGIVAEGAGAASLAAVLAGLAGPERPVVCLVSGGNASAGEVAALTAAD